MQTTAPGRQQTVMSGAALVRAGRPPERKIDEGAHERLRKSVAALASRDRRTATAGERSSAAWIADRLREVGVQSVQESTFRTQSSWRAVQLAYVAAGLLAARHRGLISRLAAVAVAVSYELDTSGRSQWVRRLLPAGSGTTVNGRIPAAGAPRRTLLLVAHHDAAHGALVWHPRVTAANRWSSRHTGRTMPSHAPLLAGIAAGAIPGRPARRVAHALLGAAGLTIAESVRHPTAPGANDNATGVAAVLELAEELTRQPLSSTEVVLVFPGGEEVGNTGIRAWMRHNRHSLDPERTLLINLDSLGSGEHLVVSTREGLSARYRERDVRLATDAAAAEGIELREGTFANVTDTFAGRLAGMRAISLLSFERGWIPNLHSPTDTPENVRSNTIEDAIALTQRIASSWDADEHPTPDPQTASNTEEDR